LPFGDPFGALKTSVFALRGVCAETREGSKAWGRANRRQRCLIAVNPGRNAEAGTYGGCFDFEAMARHPKVVIE
jgi:hypothetical protein